MNALARREHSQKELLQKILPKFPEQKALIFTALEQLVDDNLQSDQRFAEAFIRARVARGYGAGRIALELAQRGINDALVDEVLLASGVVWHDLLLEQFEKKYQSVLPKTLEEKAKLQRFFLHRGFSHQQIKGLFKL